MSQSKYTEYSKPIPVQFWLEGLGLKSGEALGVKETPLVDDKGEPTGKSRLDFLIRLEDGSAVTVWQKHIVTDGKLFL